MKRAKLTGFKVGVVLVLSALSFVVGCERAGDEESSEQKSALQESSEPAPAQPAEDSDAGDMAKNREAYGLPLPADVVRLDRERDETEVVTSLPLEELAEFYEARLRDYEVLRPPGEIRVLGLRDYMPEIYGHQFGSLVHLYYYPNKGGEQQGEEAREEIFGQEKPLSERVRGEPVTDRTSSGELLAPGARWGEPYTPPPGSPLHQERYRSNWGKPFGEWVAQ